MQLNKEHKHKLNKNYSYLNSNRTFNKNLLTRLYSNNQSFNNNNNKLTSNNSKSNLISSSPKNASIKSNTNSSSSRRNLINTSKILLKKNNTSINIKSCISKKHVTLTNNIILFHFKMSVEVIKFKQYLNIEIILLALFGSHFEILN